MATTLVPTARMLLNKYDLSGRRCKGRRWAESPYVRVLTNGCWEWQRTRTPNGYGELKIRGRRHLAHRVVYQLTHGPVSDDLQMDHLCRNRACVNPDHLEPVTRRENLARGLGKSARAMRDNHCIHGHELTTDNAYLTSRGSRQCRMCHRLRQRKRVAAQKGGAL